MNWPTVHAGITGRRRLGPARYGSDEIPADAWQLDPANDWQAEGRSVAAFAQDLVQTDPYASAMLACRVALTLGAGGLRFTSSYHGAGSPLADMRVQDEIETSLRAATSGTALDAGGTMHRRRLESVALSSMIVSGDGYLIRCWQPARAAVSISTCWRSVHPSRVRNPAGCSNWHRPQRAIAGPSGKKYRVARGNVLFEGHELKEATREPVALWVSMPKPGETNSTASRFVRVPYFDGNIRNVIHYFEPTVPGQIRGFSAFSAAFTTFKHLRGTTEAHMVGKRALACHPMFIRSSDPEVAERFARQGALAGPNSPTRPGMMSFIGEDGEVIATPYSYQGSDYREYVETVIRPASAMWGLPWQFVLAQLTNANLASSRAALDQAERTAHAWQDDHVAMVTGELDLSAMRELSARRMLPVPLDEAIQGDYLRPRRWSTDRLKEAKADKEDHEQGKSYSSIFADKGMDWKREILKGVDEAAFRKSVDPDYAAEQEAIANERNGGEE